MAIDYNNLTSILGNVFNKVLVQTTQNSGKTIVQALLNTARNHVSNRYPGSSHWDPNKISEGNDNSSNSTAEGSIDVGIAGAGRAYHDVTILPIRKQYLAIPMHAAAYGKKPADFNDLFCVKGKHALFQKHGSGIVALFALAKQAQQKQDDTLLPKDDTFVDNITTRFVKQFNDNLAKELLETFNTK